MSRMFIREVSEKDVTSLHQLIMDSTKRQSKITEASLSEDLFNLNPIARKLEEDHINGNIKFDLEPVKSSTPAVKSFVAELQGKLIGYVLYRYHYSPWMGHSVFIVDTFVGPDHRGKGVARNLIDKVFLMARQERLSSIILTIHDYESSLKSYLLETHKLKWYRNDENDWSVYRLNY